MASFLDQHWKIGPAGLWYETVGTSLPLAAAFSQCRSSLMLMNLASQALVCDDLLL